MHVVLTNPDGSKITLFKYFSPTTLADFVRSRVSLTPPKYLNDPFEFAVSRECPHREELEGMFDRYVKEDYDRLSATKQIAVSFIKFKEMRNAQREAWLSRVMSKE